MCVCVYKIFSIIFLETRRAEIYPIVDSLCGWCWKTDTPHNVASYAPVYRTHTLSLSLQDEQDERAILGIVYFLL